MICTQVRSGCRNKSALQYLPDAAKKAIDHGDLKLLFQKLLTIRFFMLRYPHWLVKTSRILGGLMLENVNQVSENRKEHLMKRTVWECWKISLTIGVAAIILSASSATAATYFDWQG